MIILLVVSVPAYLSVVQCCMGKKNADDVMLLMLLFLLLLMLLGCCHISAVQLCSVVFLFFQQFVAQGLEAETPTEKPSRHIGLMFVSQVSF